jgi:hypothetical protein
MASATPVPDERWTDVTALPDQTATQLTGVPSSVPKVPVPSTSTVLGEGGATVGPMAMPVPTARSVDNSMTSWPHPVTGSAGPTLTPPDWAWPEDGTAAEDDGGAIDGWAQMALAGQGTGAGTVPTGGQGAELPQPPPGFPVE